ncbi:MAG: MarR family transcriptional regulator [Actinobacteria bacterium]|nr:MAG: MarR family transcriptional regulator [Actinomycetota bacterium]RIK06314.1 MAG: hypothetical protein DCC48_07770 [Acidobacteriota bacterium]
MPPEIALTEVCRPVRAAVGPVAWVVLEELAAIGERSGSTVRSTTTVRQLGSDLRLSKDTVAAALRRLIADGLVQRIDEREDTSGQFGGSTYLVDFAAIGMATGQPADPRPTPSDTAASPPTDQPAPSVTARPKTDPPARRTRRPKTTAQLSLLDTEPDMP